MIPKQPWPVARLLNEYGIKPEEAAALDHFSPFSIVEQLEALRYAALGAALERVA